jgi:hypothetical protein
MGFSFLSLFKFCFSISQLNYAAGTMLMIFIPIAGARMMMVCNFSERKERREGEEGGDDVTKKC